MRDVRIPPFVAPLVTERAKLDKETVSSLTPEARPTIPMFLIVTKGVKVPTISRGEPLVLF